MLSTTPNDLNTVTIAGRIVAKPAYSARLGALSVTLLNTRTAGDPRDPDIVETRIVVCLPPRLAPFAGCFKVGGHVTFTARLETRTLAPDNKAMLVVVATDYAINNTRDTVRESGHGDGADEFEAQSRPISERYARRSWHAEQPDFGADDPST